MARAATEDRRNPPQKPPRRVAPALEREMSELRVVRKVRMSLATKFTLPVVALLSLVVILFGMVVYAHMANALDQELDSSGLLAATLAASPEIDSWERNYNTIANLRNRLAAIESELELARGNLAQGSEPSRSAEEAEIRKKLEKFDEEQRIYNQNRLNRLRNEHGALDVLIVARTTGLVASASGTDEARFKPVWRQSVGDTPIESTVIESGEFMSTKSPPEPARAFTSTIVNRKGQEVGSATVVFSERSLEQQLDKLRQWIMFFCVVGVVACAAVGWLTAKLITRPLKDLLEDIETVAAGNLDHRTPSKTSDEIGVLASSFDGMTRNLAAAELMRQDLVQKDHEVKIAHEVQERLFPETLPRRPGIELEASNWLAGSLSSDLFDVHELDDGRILVLVMTASGRGIPAAIVLSMARSLARAAVARNPEPRDLLIELNRLLAPDLKRGFFVSVMCALIDPETGHVVAASAGHRVPALHFVSQKGGLAKIQPDGIALGLDRGPVFERSLVPVSLNLAEGDALILATEGAMRVAAQGGTSSDETTFLKTVLGAAKQGVSGLAERVVAAVSGRNEDPAGAHDLTVVTAARTATGGPR
jgi:serine phosphatase RsbU (regulator of sigma subunit)